MNNPNFMALVACVVGLLLVGGGITVYLLTGDDAGRSFGALLVGSGTTILPFAGRDVVKGLHKPPQE